MTEKEENRVQHLLDCCDLNGHLDINAEDMVLILKYQRELGIEDGKRSVLKETLMPYDCESIEDLLTNVQNKVLNEVQNRILSTIGHKVWETCSVAFERELRKIIEQVKWDFQISKEDIER